MPMPAYRIIKLKNMSPLHIGMGKENYDFSSDELQSDALSSALAALRASLGKDKDIDKFLQSFSISSAFPFYKDNYFLPVYPGKLSIQVKGQTESQYRKKLKKVRFIALPFWGKLIEGETLTINENLIVGPYVVEENKKLPVLYKRATLQRVRVPRDNNVNENKLFYFEWTYFNPEGGLFCLVDADDNTFKEIRQLFQQLGEEGIGTDRTIGGGRFKIEESDEALHIPEVKDANARLLLSLYIPTKEELQTLHLPDSRYNLLLRGGYMAGSSQTEYRHLWKKNIYMFNTGSVFTSPGALKGKVVNLRPEWEAASMHNVYRSGRPLSVPIKLKIE